MTTSQNAVSVKPCPPGQCVYRVIHCCDEVSGDDRDIVECVRCGQQRNVRCNFDEEYS